MRCYAYERYLSDPDGWEIVVNDLDCLVTKKDFKRIEKLVGKYGHKYHGSDDDAWVEWQRTFLNATNCIKIPEGVFEEDEGDKGYDSDNPIGVDEDEHALARDYFLAYHQWNAYHKWLESRPGPAGDFEEFEVSRYR